MFSTQLNNMSQWVEKYPQVRVENKHTLPKTNIDPDVLAPWKIVFLYQPGSMLVFQGVILRQTHPAGGLDHSASWTLDCIRNHQLVGPFNPPQSSGAFGRFHRRRRTEEEFRPDPVGRGRRRNPCSAKTALRSDWEGQCSEVRRLYRL